MFSCCVRQGKFILGLCHWDHGLLPDITKSLFHPHGRSNLPILCCQYHSFWWFGNINSQGISRHGINHVCPKCGWYHMEWVTSNNRTWCISELYLPDFWFLVFENKLYTIYIQFNYFFFQNRLHKIEKKLCQYPIAWLLFLLALCGWAVGYISYAVPKAGIKGRDK